MRNLIRSALCLLALGAFALDVARDISCADAGDADDVCCACSCGSHQLPQAPVAPAVALRPTGYAAFQPQPYDLLSPRLIFHPPRLAA